VRRLTHLCNAVRTLSPYGSIVFTGVPSEEGSTDLWQGRVMLGDVILVETEGEIEAVLTELTNKLELISQRMLTSLASSHPPAGQEDPPPSSR